MRPCRGKEGGRGQRDGSLHINQELESNFSLELIAIHPSVRQLENVATQQKATEKNGREMRISARMVGRWKDKQEKVSKSTYLILEIMKELERNSPENILISKEEATNNITQ